MQLQLTETFTFPVIKMFFTRKTPLTKLLWQFRGPDEFLTSILGSNPLDTIVMDEFGPISIEFNKGKVKIWVLVAVKFVTWRVHLIPMAHQDTTNLLMALEILVARRGKFCNLVLDKHSTRLVLGTEPKLYKVDSSIPMRHRNPMLYNLEDKQPGRIRY